MQSICTLSLSVNFLSLFPEVLLCSRTMRSFGHSTCMLPLRTLPFHSSPILHYVVPCLVILLIAPLIPFTFGVEFEFLFAVNTDVVVQDPTHFLSPHTGLESSPAFKPFCKTAVSSRSPSGLEKGALGSSSSTTINPAASCSTGADSKLFRTAEYVACIMKSHG